MTQKHARSRAKRYSRREHEIKQRPPQPRTISCLRCNKPTIDRGSEYCDGCEIDYAGQ